MMLKKNVLIWLIVGSMLITMIPQSVFASESAIEIPDVFVAEDLPEECPGIPDEVENGDFDQNDSLEGEVEDPEVLSSDMLIETPDTELLQQDLFTEEGVEDEDELPDEEPVIEAIPNNGERLSTSEEIIDDFEDTDFVKRDSEEPIELQSASSRQKLELAAEPDFSKAILIDSSEKEFIAKDITLNEDNPSIMYKFTPESDKLIKPSWSYADCTIYDGSGDIILKQKYQYPTYDNIEYGVETGSTYYIEFSKGDLSFMITDISILFGDPFYLAYNEGYSKMYATADEMVSLSVDYHGLFENYARYQWYLNDEPIIGATENTYCFTAKKHAIYECEVTNAYYSGLEDTISFEIWIDNGFSASGSGGGVVEPGTSVTMHVTAVCDQGELHYHWEKENSDEEEDEILQADGNILNVIIEKDCIYSVVVCDDYGNERGFYFQYEVNDYIRGDGSVNDPQYYWAARGEKVTIAITMSGINEEFISCRWYQGWFNKEEKGVLLPNTGSSITVEAGPDGINKWKDYYCVASCKGEQVVQQFRVYYQDEVQEKIIEIGEKVRNRYDYYYKFRTKKPGTYKIICEKDGSDSIQPYQMNLLDSTKRELKAYDELGQTNIKRKIIVCDLEGDRDYYIRLYATNDSPFYSLLIEYTGEECTHEWNEGVVTQKATTSATGHKTYTCLLCGTTKIEIIEKLTPVPTSSATPSLIPTKAPIPTPTPKPTEAPATDSNLYYSSVDHTMGVLRDKTDTENSTFELRLKSSKQTKTSLDIGWKGISGADGYLVYGSKVGDSLKRLSVQTDTTFKYLGLKKGTYYKVAVVAFENISGSIKTIAESKIIYIATKGGKAANIKQIKVTAPKNKKVTLKLKKKKKKTTTIKTKITKTGKKLKTYQKLRYVSSNPKVAAVSKSGKVTAKGVGDCVIFIYAQNGISAKVKVHVK